MNGGLRWATSIPFWGLPQVAPPLANITATYGANFALETAFQAIQLVLVNASKQPQPFAGALLAPSAFALPRTTPVDAAGRPLGWIRATVNGNPTPTLPPAPGADVPSITLSDVVHVQSQPRADGGRFPLLFTRFLSRQNPTWRAGLAANEVFDLYDTQSGGRGLRAYSAVGDFLDDQRDLLNDDLVLPDMFHSAIAGVRFLAQHHCFTLLSCGDSLTSGTGTTSHHGGFGMLASRYLSDAGCLVSHAAHGWPGQTVNDIAANAAIMLDLAPPDVMTCVIDSPNDYTWVTENAEGCRLAQQATILSLVRKAAALGVLAVLLSPIPFAGYDDESTFGVQRRRSGAFARGLAEPGVMKLDAQRLLGGQAPEGSGFPVLPPHFRASDQAHLNDLGHEILAAALCDLLRAPLHDLKK